MPSLVRWSLLASGLIGRALAGFADLPKTQMASMPYTCTLPMEEEQELFSTEVGKAMWDTGSSLSETLPSAAEEAAYSFCDEQVIPPGEPSDEPPPDNENISFTPLNRTREDLLQICARALSEQVVNTTLRRLGECNATLVEELCRETEPAKFCVKAGAQENPDDAASCLLTRVGDRGEKVAYTTECIEGFYCKGKNDDPRACKKGRYCPENISESRDCAQGHTCIFANHQVACTNESDVMLTGTRCDRDWEKRVLLPDVCPFHYYCQGGRRLHCPEGHFCPDGADHPHVCGWLEQCPERTGFPGRLYPALVYSAWMLLQIGVAMALFKEGVCGAQWKVQGLILTGGFAAFVASEYIMEPFGYIGDHIAFMMLYVWGALWCAVFAPMLGVGERNDCKSVICNFISMIIGVYAVFGISQSIWSVAFLGVLVPAFFLNRFVLNNSDSQAWVQTTLYFVAIGLVISLTIFAQPAFGRTSIFITGLLCIPLLFSPVLATLNALLSLRSSGNLKEAEVGKRATEHNRPVQDEEARKAAFKAEFMMVRQTDSERPAKKNAGRWSARWSPRPNDGKPPLRNDPTHSTEIELSDVSAKHQALLSESASGKLSLMGGVAGAVEEITGSRDITGQHSNAPGTGSKSLAPPDQHPEQWATVATLHTDAKPEDIEKGQSKKPREEGIGISLRNMSLLLRNGQSILDDINLSIPPSSACAVMGPSGSGKSSITNVLSGRAGYGVVLGDILVNNRDDIPLRDLRGVTGFVPQDDVMNRELTCLENVAFQAKMRLPVDRRDPDEMLDMLTWADEMASGILKNFGLLHVKDSRIGDEDTRGVSGGQRKRVSIAMEFICQPSLLFLDEPTTGLDSTTSHRVIELVTQYAHDMNCTTAAVIHQPRFETLLLFDYVILLAAGGHLTYAGPTKSVVKYFKAVLGVPFPERVNPADVFMDAMSLDSAKIMFDMGKLDCDDFETHLKDTTSFGLWLSSNWRRKTEEYTPLEQITCEADLPDLFPDLPNPGEILLVHVRRSITQLERSSFKVLSQLVLLATGTGVITIAIPAQDQFMRYWFHLGMALLFLMLAQGIAAQRVFGGPERVVAWREAGVKVNMSYFFLGRDVISLFEVSAGATVFAAIYWTYGPLLVDFHTVLWTAFAFNYAAYGFGFLWSILLDSSTAQMMVISTTFIFFFLTGIQPGFMSLISPGGGGLVYAMSFSPMRWAHGYLTYMHMMASQGSQFMNPLIYLEQQFILEAFGAVVDEDFADICGPKGPANVITRWLGDGDTKPMGYNCSLQQLFLLGIYLRFVCALALTATCKTQSTGGGALFSGHHRSLFGDLAGPVLNLVFWSFLVVLTTCQVSVLLLTK